jgi:hypothetical protein
LTAQGAHEVPRMKFRVELVCLNDGGEQRCRVMEMERTELAMETLGLSVAEGKAMLHGVQDFVASQQALEGSQPPACLSGLRVRAGLPALAAR